MSRPLIGQMLSRMGKLSGLDIDEILAEQSVSRQPFGHIALSWGLCEPEHLCQAWCDQLVAANNCLELLQLADEREAQAFPGEVARRLRVVPLRSIGNQLVVAAAGPLDSLALAELMQSSGREIRFVQAEVHTIDEAIARYYPQGGGEK